VLIIPCDYQVTTAAGTMIRADQASADAVFERRSCGTGTKGPRISDRALTATARPRQFLLIRRLISRPAQLTFYLCWAPEGRPATMTYFITIAGRHNGRGTFKTGKDVLGWAQSQVRSRDGICRHTALAALAQLRHAAIRNAQCGGIHLAPAPDAGSPGPDRPGPADSSPDGEDVNDADLRIPSATHPCPPAAASPARPAPASSSCRSPRPRGRPAWPRR
jgi:hypothetical protein